jgi:DNA-binding CsgD family transcriptional regulator
LVAGTLDNLGYLELSAGDLEPARGHLAEALDAARALNDRSTILYQAFNLGLAEYLGGSPEAARALFAESFDLARRTGTRSQVPYALVGLALAGRGGADPGWSARLHGAADQAFADLGETIEPLEGRLAGLDRQRLRAAMGDGAFDAEYAAGRTLDVSFVAHQALQGKQPPPGDAPGGEPDAAVSGEAVTVLTPRELDVLRLLAQGLSNPDIGGRLYLSQHTVRRHVSNILRKLGLSSRSAAAAWGVRAGLV